MSGGIPPLAHIHYWHPQEHLYSYLIIPARHTVREKYSAGTVSADTLETKTSTTHTTVITTNIGNNFKCVFEDIVQSFWIK